MIGAGEEAQEIPCCHRQAGDYPAGTIDSHGGPEALNDRSPRPDRVWNRIPSSRGAEAVATRAGGALHRKPEPFVSEASVYRLLKARDPIGSPDFIIQPVVLKT